MSPAPPFRKDLWPPLPHSRPFIDNREIRAAGRVLLSGQLAAGPRVEALEKKLCSLSGHTTGVAVSSGTAALYLALRALGAKRGRSVIIPSYVCTALLHAVLQTGARPLMSDVDPVTGLMRPQDAREVLEKKCVAIIVPHLFGTMVDISAFNRLGVPVIEDCAQCFGTSYGTHPAGSQGACAVFSFYATKLICGAEGGMVATSDSRIAAFIREQREYDNRMEFKPSFNFKLSDLHAAVAYSQLKKLGQMVRARRKVAAWYSDGLAGLPGLQVPLAGSRCQPVWFRYVLQCSKGADILKEKLRQRGIMASRPIFRPLHLYLRKKGCPDTMQAWHKHLSLPIYPGITAVTARRVIRIVHQVYREVYP